MHDLAKYIMQGPRQAAIVAFFATMVPLLFWVGAAAIALIVLRHGVAKGISVAVWPMIPAIAWLYGANDPNALIVIPSVIVMAGVLRATVSWHKAFVAGGLIGVFVGTTAPVLLPESIAFLLEIAGTIFEQIALTSAENGGAFESFEAGSESEALFHSLVIASFSASIYGMSIFSVFLARSWQSRLFNPGGWQKEFHQIRLHPATLPVVLALLVLLPSIGIRSAVILMMALIPMVVSGLALTHGLIYKKQLGGQWLVALYVAIFLLFPTFLMLLAVLALFDSLVNFRARV